jgi:hypothetical protein
MLEEVLLITVKVRRASYRSLFRGKGIQHLEKVTLAMFSLVSV